jgi:hypothetical protein
VRLQQQRTMGRFRREYPTKERQGGQDESRLLVWQRRCPC